MACRDCGQSAAALESQGPRLAFSGPLDGVTVDVVAVGTLTHKNLSMVRDFFALVYDQMTAHAAAEEATDG